MQEILFQFYSIYTFKKELYRKLKTNQLNDKVFNQFLDNLL